MKNENILELICKRRLIFLSSLLFVISACVSSKNIPIPSTVDAIKINISETQTSYSSSTSTPEFNYVTLHEPFKCNALISQNDSFNGVFKKQCVDEHHGHFDLSPSKVCNGDFSVFAPVSGQITVFQNNGKWSSSNIVLKPNELIVGIENAFSFMGIEFDPHKVKQIIINLGHIEYNFPFDKNPNTFDFHVQQGDLIGKLSYEPLSKFKWILAFQISVFYESKNGQIEYFLSPDLFQHAKWDCNPNTPYDCSPTLNDYKSGCK